MPRKRKATKKYGSARPSKKMRKNFSSDSDEVEFRSDSSSSDYDALLFVEEEQNFARTSRNRRRNAARNIQAWINRNVCDNCQLDCTILPRCSSRQQKQQVLGKKSTATTSQRGANRERQCRKQVRYTRGRPRCTPRRGNLENDLSSDQSDDDRHALISRSDTSTSRRGGTRAPPRRQQYASRAQRNTSLAIGKKRTRVKIQESSSTLSSESLDLEETECAAPGRFFLIFCKPSTGLLENISNTGENSTGQQQAQENNKNNETCPQAPQEQPATMPSVEILNNPETEQPTTSQTEFDSIATNINSENEDSYLDVLFVTADDIADEVGLDILGAGDGHHIVDQTAVQLAMACGLLSEVESGELDTPENSIMDILNSEEEHQEGENDEQNENNYGN